MVEELGSGTGGEVRKWRTRVMEPSGFRTTGMKVKGFLVESVASMLYVKSQFVLNRFEKLLKISKRGIYAYIRYNNRER